MFYNRQEAVAYARKWALSRNPAYYDYENIGGDCTNFASQSVFAGIKVMDYTPLYGWYYKNANDKTPSWTGVQYLYDYLIKTRKPPGPIGREVDMQDVVPGDIVQLSFDGIQFRHSPFILSRGAPVTPDNLLIAAHTYDALDRPLSTYSFEKARFIHIQDRY